MEAVLDWVAVYGPGALFALLLLGVVGLPIPDETLLVFSGYLISQGKLNREATALAAIAGSLSGITISYVIGRTLGLGVVHHFGKYLHVDDEKLSYVRTWFDRRGHWALFIGYYIAGVRHLTAILAGASKLRFRNFALPAFSGGICWVVLFLSIGFYVGRAVGDDWRRIFAVIERYLHLLSYLLLTAGALYLLWRWGRQRGWWQRPF
jgi:membrane protein DedA with SNARE-associated domain